MRERSLIMVIITVTLFIILLVMIVVIGFAMIGSTDSSGMENTSGFARFIASAELAIYSWVTSIIAIVKEFLQSFLGTSF